MRAVCFECRAPAEHEHHVVPRSLGGVRTIPLCARCHGLVHSADLTRIGTLTRKALQHKKARGEYTGGKAPYGYQLSDDGVTLVEHEAEQLVIAAAVQYRAAGLSLRATSAQLADLGMFNRKGRPFAASAMHALVKGRETAVLAARAGRIDAGNE